MSELSAQDRLVKESLALQQGVIPDLKEIAKDQIKYPTLAGLGLYALMDSYGATVKVDGRLWEEEELEQNATIRVWFSALSNYRVTIRKGKVEVYDQDNERVTDDRTIEQLISQLVVSNGVYQLSNPEFEEEHRRVLQ